MPARKQAAKKVKSIERDDHGLITQPKVDYIFTDDGFVDWRKMVKEEFLVPNRQKTQETDVSKLEDHQLIILLGGIKELAQIRGALASGFEPGKSYSKYARDQKGLDVQNCGWENYEREEKVDVVTAFHVFEHLIDPLKAFHKSVSWLNVGGIIYIEVPNIANGLKRKGFGSLHMAHTIGFGRYSLELLGAYCDMKILEVFNGYNIGIIFKKGVPRPLDKIKKDSIDEFKNLNLKQINKQFWIYSASKLFGKRSVD